MLSFCMSVKTGTYLGTTHDAQPSNTSDHIVTITYPDGTTEAAMQIANNVPKLTLTRINLKTIPVAATSSALASTPDTLYAAGSPRVRITRFM